MKDFEQINMNALSVDWFISPLEYLYSDGKELLDKLFHNESTPSESFDRESVPLIYKTSMQIDFRAKMMVLAYMRQDISKSYGLEIENGLIHLYRLDYASCISQWMYVIEGYCRDLFSVSSLSNVKKSSWTYPTSESTEHDNLIQSLSGSLSDYLTNVFFKSTNNLSIERLSRNLLLHGNVKNKNFYSQKNCLILMFILDTLVVIEMAKNREFPQMFDEREDELQKITQRKELYTQVQRTSTDYSNQLRLEILKEYM